MLAPAARSTIDDAIDYSDADEALREFAEATPTVEIPYETMAAVVEGRLQ